MNAMNDAQTQRRYDSTNAPNVIDVLNDPNDLNAKLHLHQRPQDYTHCSRRNGS